MRKLCTLLYALALAPLALVTACDDGIAPRVATPFDARQALATVDPLAAVTDAGIFDSFRGALSFFAASIRSGTTAALSGSAAGGGSRASGRGVAVLAAQIGAGEIPLALRGKTLIYDPAANAYVPDLAALGAPEAGVRLALYAWEPDRGIPSFPLARIGYADIAPFRSSTPSPVLTRFVVVRDAPPAVLSDFVAFRDSAAAAITFGLEGSATSATATVHISVVGTESGAAGQRHFAASSTLSVESLGILSQQQLTSDQTAASQQGKLELRYDNHTFTEENTGSGVEVKFDGARYARIVVPSPGAEAQYLKADGTPLLSQEIADLNALLERVILAHFFWLDLASQ